MKIVASHDLGSLGARDGPPFTYDWAMPSLMPLTLPWLALLTLLALKPNRHPQAWWIWLPLTLTIGLTLGLRSALDFIPSEPLDLFSESFQALAFGVAAVWLLPFRLDRLPRFVAYLTLLFTLGTVGLVALVVRQDLTELWWVPGILVLGICVGALATGLSFAGLACRRAYRPVRLTLWLGAWVAGAWIVLTTPFFLLALASSGADLEGMLSFVGAILGFAAATLIIALPFLVLSFANPFFRERLQRLCRIPADAPPMPSPSPAPATA